MVHYIWHSVGLYTEGVYIVINLGGMLAMLMSVIEMTERLPIFYHSSGRCVIR